MDLSVELAAEMVLMGEVAATLDEARERSAGGRSPTARPWPGSASSSGPRGATRTRSTTRRKLPQPKGRIEVDSKRAGYVHALLARPIGHATMLLGAGRARVDSKIDPSVGVILHKKVGDRVEVGEPLCTVLVNDDPGIDVALGMIGDSVPDRGRPGHPRPL